MPCTHRPRGSRLVKRSAVRSEACYRALLECAADGIITIDAASIIESVNPAAERMFGYRGEEVVGHNVKILMPQSYQQEHDGYLARYQETGENKTIGTGREVVGRRQDGSVFPLNLRISEVSSDGSKFFVGVLRDITERKEAEEALRHERDFAESLIETAQVIVLALDTKGRIVRYNRYMEEISGYRLDEVRNMPWVPTFVPKRDQDRISEVFQRVLAAIPTAAITNPIVTRDNDERLIEWHNTPLQDATGTTTGVLAVGQDITERTDLESQLRRAHKMDAIGRLAGCIAHDFNTLLGSIYGYSELALDQLPIGHNLRRSIEQIHRSAERGAALTRQLLAFSRRQVLRPRLISLNAVVADMGDLLRRLTTEDIELVFDLEPALGQARVDAGQFEQVIMNLVVNAADAMPRGGRLVIESANRNIDAGHPDRGAVLATGRYVMVAVTDNGCGMDAETQSHVFEPFYTTKEKGKGTGLGLSTVYGIVRQSGGGVSIISEPSHGTRVKIYLLRSDEAAENISCQPTEDAPEQGNETILLVEDDEMFLELTTEVLESQGYAVLSASSPSHALALSQGHPDPIHLLLTDMMMPEMTGSELAKRLAVDRPGLAVLMMSGYSDEVLEEHGATTMDHAFIHKPFTTRDLARLVRETLDEATS